MKRREALDKIKLKFPYPAAREGQLELILDIMKAYASGKKYVIVSAPTGVGKSVIGYTLMNILKSGYVLTSQKVLQEQYYNDFKIPFVLGRSNYDCLRAPSAKCNTGLCGGKTSKCCKDRAGNVICPYLSQKINCLSSKFSNLNYAYFLALSKAGSDDSPSALAKRELIVCDEAHSLEKELLNVYSLRVNDILLKFIGAEGLTVPRVIESDSKMIEWAIRGLNEGATRAFAWLDGRIAKLSSKMKMTREYKSYMQKRQAADEICEKTKLLKELYEKNEKIVVSIENDTLVLTPLKCNTLFQKMLDPLGERFLMMSATILDPKEFIKTLGLDEKLCEVISIDSPFPVENRLVEFCPVGSMSMKNKDATIPKLIKKVDEILKANPDVKGIIHTVNYEIASKIVDGLMFSDQAKRLLLPKGQDKQLILNGFYESSEPYVLVSPSLTEGIDLKDDLSRLCIICKVPYPSLGDKWTKERMEDDNEWYTSQTCTTLVQMTGRSIRSKEDYAKSYILDSDFERLAAKAIDIFPSWWKDSIITRS